MAPDDDSSDILSELHRQDHGIAAAFWRARQEAESWSRVYEHIRWDAVREARDQGLSLAQIAAKWELSKPMVARLLVTVDSPMEKPGWDEAERRRFDDTWIAAGNPGVASPAGQLRHGLIDEDNYRRLEAHQVQAHKSIPRQLHDAVTAHPGLTARELLSHMTVAVQSAVTVSFAHHADEAGVAVDGDGRYWPTVAPSDLRPGDRIPRHPNEFRRPEGEWVTVEQLHTSDAGRVCEIQVLLADGLRSTFPEVAERYPLDRSAPEDEGGLDHCAHCGCAAAEHTTRCPNCDENPHPWPYGH